MSSVFRKDDQKTVKPKRNVYDKTHSTNITAQFGQLMPVFCKPVMVGESVKIKYKHNFNMLPFVFPVQTRVRASLNFFYVRNRTLWKDWEDFQFKMKPNLLKPYLKFTNKTKRSLLRVGGLLDNIGFDTVTKHNVPTGVGLDMPVGKESILFKIYNPYTNEYEDAGGAMLKFPFSAFSTLIGNAMYMPWSSAEVTMSSTTNALNAAVFVPYRYPIKANSLGSIYLKYDDGATSGDTYYFLARVSKLVNDAEYITTNRSEATAVSTRQRGTANDAPRSSVGSRRNSSSTEQVIRTESAGFEDSFIVIKSVPGVVSLVAPDGYILKEILGVFYGNNAYQFNGTWPCYVSVNPADYPNHGIHVCDIAMPWFPYANTSVDNEKTIRCCALPLRGYEAIYNSFYRNTANNPFMINGVAEYNKYIENDEGGADTYEYVQHYRNWQDDAYTTALHSPQHGQAPLVGLVNQNVINQTVTVTFANDDGTTNRVRFAAASNVNDPGASRLIQLATAPTNQNSVNSPDAPSDGYVGQLQEAMMEAVKFGISINDFRNVNSFQRWLENNVRKGYKYRDQIKAHYGVSVRYDTLQMPEYLGGSSRDMYVNQVTQTVENDNGVLGDYAGQGYISGGSKHSINHFCDEEGWIIGILSIMPSANYSQVIPKYLLRQDAFDYYSPEFGKIGMQPILNREINPIGSFYDDTGDKIFGYQRPWWDYLDTPDTIHGKFRTEFQNFVLTRTFDTTPTLSKDFLVYNPDSVNNIFYVDDDEDKILGQILFEYRVRLPIPLYGTPALE